MFIPLGDEPNPRGVPWVTYALIAVNSAVFILIALPLSVTQANPSDPALTEYVSMLIELNHQLSIEQLLQQVSAYDLLVFNYGFRPADPSLLTLMSSMFLHSGFMHLAGNMLFLWIYGDNVEHRLGPGRYLVAYLVTGAAATSFHTAFAMDSPLPLVGASGAISGVLGFYFIWFPHNRVRLLIAFFPFFMNVVRVPARLVLGMYLIVNNLVPFLITQGIENGGGVAYGAHIGGFLGGLGWSWWAGRREVIGRPQTYQPMDSTMETSPGETVAQLITEGRFRKAAPAYFQLPTEQTRGLFTPVNSIAFGDWLSTNGHAEAALVIYQRHLRDHPMGPLAAEAHLGAGLIQLNKLKQPTAAYQHFVEIFDLNPNPEIASLARQALSEIAAIQKFQVSGQKPDIH